MTLPRHISQFTQVLMTAGIQSALRYLNAGVPHRFSAIYRRAAGHYENLYLHDKQGEIVPEFLAVVPVEVSFCQFVLKDTPFVTADSTTDPRLDGHRYQGVVVSYHGVPILGDDGEVWGTVCHFDTEAHPLPDAEFALLQAAARSLPIALLEGSVAGPAAG